MVGCLSDPNIEDLMKQYALAINSQDFEMVKACFHEEYLYQEEDIVQLQRLGLAQGVFQSRAEYIRSAWEGLTDFSALIKRMIYSGDEVFVSWSISGRHTGYFHKLPPSNRKIEYRTFSVYKIKDNKIIESDSVAEWLLVLNQIGKAIIEENNEEKVSEYLDYLREIGLSPN